MTGGGVTLRTPTRPGKVRRSWATSVALGATLALASAPVLAQDETSASGYPTGFNPTQLAVGPDGSLYASDCAAARVYRIEPDGVSVVIGSGPGGFGAGFKGDGGPATEAETLCPYGIAFDPEGRLLLVDHGNNRVRRVDEAGVITTIAGSGPGQFQGGFEGDGGPATEGLMQEPTGIAVDDDGVIFVVRPRQRPGPADRHRRRHHDRGRERRRDAASPGDGGPATEASLDDPAAWPWTTRATCTSRTPTTPASGGSRPDGAIETIAGTGEVRLGRRRRAGHRGDALRPRAASCSTTAGNLYIGDPDGNRIRMISPDGTITTFAGTGEAGYDGDGGPATEATFSLAGDPASLAIDASGNIYIGDSGNHVIRVVDPSGIISTLEVARIAR